MMKKDSVGLVLFSVGISLFGWGCNDNANTSPTAANGDTGAIATSGTNGSSSGGGPSITGAGRTSLYGGTSSSATGGNATKTAGAGGGAAGDKGSSTGAGRGGTIATAGKGGAAAKGGCCDTPPTSDGGRPSPAATPYVWGVGIGVSDLPKATGFYTEIMKMTVEKEVTRDQGKANERTETVLWAKQADRGSRVVLMSYKDGRNTEKITAKLVFYAQNVSGTVTAANAAGYGTILPGTAVAQITGPSTYTHEILNLIGAPPAGTTITVPYLIAIGFSVSDLAAARKFYADAFAMVETTPYSGMVTDATGTAWIDEQSMEYSTQGGAGLVLQFWNSTPARNSKDNPVKVVTFVPDAQAYADKIVAAGGSVVEKAQPTPVYDNRILIVAKDPDGYIIELVQ